MADNKHRIKMAKATKSDIKNLLLLYNVLENIVKYQATTKSDFDHFKEDEKKLLDRIFREEDEIDYEEVVSLLHRLTFGFHRVVLGYEVLDSNCANQNLDYLDFNEHITNALLVFDDLKEKLVQGLQITVTPNSVLGKLITGKIEGKEATDE